MENRMVRAGIRNRNVGVLVSLLLALVLTAGCQSDRTAFADLPDMASGQVADSSGSQTPAQGSSAAPLPTPTGANSESVRVPAAHTGKGDPSNEAIRSGETLRVTFSDTLTPLPAMDEKVKDDGTITLMFDKTFHAVGKTPGELAREIRKMYVPDYYAQLTVSVIRDVLRTFYVDGEVRAASKQPYTGPIK